MRKSSFLPDKTIHFATTVVKQWDILSSSCTCLAKNRKAFWATFIYVKYHHTLPLPCSCSGIQNFLPSFCTCSEQPGSWIKKWYLVLINVGLKCLTFVGTCVRWRSRKIFCVHHFRIMFFMLASKAQLHIPKLEVGWLKSKERKKGYILIWFFIFRFPQDSLSSVFGMISTAPYVGALAGTALAIYVQAGDSIKKGLSWVWLELTFYSLG